MNCLFISQAKELQIYDLDLSYARMNTDSVLLLKLMLGITYLLLMLLKDATDEYPIVANSFMDLQLLYDRSWQYVQDVSARKILMPSLYHLFKFLMQLEAMNIFSPCMNVLLEISDPSCLGLKLRDVKF